MEPSQPAPALDPGDTVKLTILDVSTKPKPFAETILGSLPTELLQTVVRCFADRDLLAITRISAKPRALAERRLYHTISIPRVPKEYGELGNSSEHWQFCRALSVRPDLAERMVNLDMIVTEDEHQVDIPAKDIIPGRASFSPTFKAKISQVNIAGMIIQRLS